MSDKKSRGNLKEKIVTIYESLFQVNALKRNNKLRFVQYSNLG